MSSKRKSAKKAGFDSNFEKELYEGPLSGALYHPTKINYLIPARYANYEPDFQIGNKLIEAKGYFRRGDTQRYKNINTSLKDTQWELVFIFQRPHSPVAGAQKRSNGTKLTHAEWADKQGIRWYSAENAHLLWEET